MTYPTMPPGTCRESAWVVAACYPELKYAEGHRALILRVDGRTVRDSIEHAWNVAPGGDIVDCTLDPHLRQAAENRQAKLEYALTDPASWWPASIGAAADEMARAARFQAAGRSPGDRVQIVEAIGRMFLVDARGRGRS